MKDRDFNSYCLGIVKRDASVCCYLHGTGSVFQSGGHSIVDIVCHESKVFNIYFENPSEYDGIKTKTIVTKRIEPEGRLYPDGIDLATESVTYYSKNIYHYNKKGYIEKITLEESADEEYGFELTRETLLKYDSNNNLIEIEENRYTPDYIDVKAGDYFDYYDINGNLVEIPEKNVEIDINQYFDRQRYHVLEDTIKYIYEFDSAGRQVRTLLFKNNKFICKTIYRYASGWDYFEPGFSEIWADTKTNPAYRENWEQYLENGEPIISSHLINAENSRGSDYSPSDSHHLDENGNIEKRFANRVYISNIDEKGNLIETNYHFQNIWKNAKSSKFPINNYRYTLQYESSDPDIESGNYHEAWGYKYEGVFGTDLSNRHEEVVQYYSIRDDADNIIKLTGKKDLNHIRRYAGAYDFQEDFDEYDRVGLIKINTKTKWDKDGPQREVAMEENRFFIYDSNDNLIVIRGECTDDVDKYKRGDGAIVEFQTTFEYDSNNNLVKVNDSDHTGYFERSKYEYKSSEGFSKIAEYEYDKLNRLKKQRIESNVLHGITHSIEYSEFDYEFYD